MKWLKNQASWTSWAILGTFINFAVLAVLLSVMDIPVQSQPCILFPIVQRIDVPPTRKSALFDRGIHLLPCEVRNPLLGVESISVYRDYNRQIGRAIAVAESRGLKIFPVQLYVIPDIFPLVKLTNGSVYIPQKFWRNGDSLEDILVSVWSKKDIVAHSY